MFKVFYTLFEHSNLLNDIRLASLPKALLKNMTLTMRKLLLLLLALHLSDVSLLWLPFTVGLFIRWMWRILSSMETSKKKCTCNHPLAILTQVVKFVTFVVLFMASSRLLGVGLKSLAQLLLSRVSIRWHEYYWRWFCIYLLSSAFP